MSARDYASKAITGGASAEFRRKVSAAFEADLCPETGAPRIRFNFPNGMSASLVLRQPLGRSGCDFLMASLAMYPTGQRGKGKTTIFGNELSPEEVVHWLAHIDMQQAVS